MAIMSFIILAPGQKIIKLFYSRILQTSLQAKAFVPFKPFLPSVMFAGKAGAYPKVEHLIGALPWSAPFRSCPVRLARGLTHKY